MTKIVTKRIGFSGVFWLVLFLLANPCCAFHPQTDDSKWHGYARINFEIEGQDAYLVVPENVAQGRPWVWRARFPNYHPEIDIELLQRGYHIGFVNVAGLFGNQRAVQIGDAFYNHVRKQAKLSPQVTLEGVSRGGLFVYQWASKHPQRVANIFCDTPVCDIRSWPGGKGKGRGAPSQWNQCLAAYQAESETLSPADGNMMVHAEIIAGAGIPVLHIVTEDDQIVPPKENTYLLAKSLEKLGHPMKVISIPNGTPQSSGHHFAHKNIEPIVSFITQQKAASESLLDMIRSAKRIVFLGDSITYAGEYVARLEVGLLEEGLTNSPKFINVGLPSETVSGLSENGHAGGRFPRPDLEERLDRVIQTTKPDLVFACYGINCGIYQPFSEERFEKYKSGIGNLRTAVESAGAKLIFVTPPTFDDLRGKKAFSYDDVMAVYSDWLVAQRKQGWHVIDLHKAMVDATQNARRKDDQFTFQPDAVHPNTDGHKFIGQFLLSQIKGSEGQIIRNESEDTTRQDETILKLVRQRSNLWRDAYLTSSGHQRPGITKGLSLIEAKEQAEKLTKEINGFLEKNKESK